METSSITRGPSQRRVTRVRHELRVRQLTVARVAALGASMVAITFTGDELAGFTSLSFDDHVKLMLPSPDGEPARRDYTPRHFDAERSELTIEFVLHGHGAASDWARQAQAGQTVTIGGPRGSMIIPTDCAWHVLAGDTSALPAMHRRLAELPPGARVFVIGEVADPGDERRFETQADVQVQWVRNADAWLAALRALELPPGEGFVWCAGEAATMARARDVLLNEKRHPLEAMRVSAYWKAGAPAFHESL
jgi:NADPH-dependent ferric siderophore reductase